MDLGLLDSIIMEATLGLIETYMLYLFPTSFHPSSFIFPPFLGLDTGVLTAVKDRVLDTATLEIRGHDVDMEDVAAVDREGVRVTIGRVKGLVDGVGKRAPLGLTLSVLGTLTVTVVVVSTTACCCCSVGEDFLLPLLLPVLVVLLVSAGSSIACFSSVISFSSDISSSSSSPSSIEPLPFFSNALK